MAELIAARAGVEVTKPLSAGDACRCWEPNGEVGACGSACAARLQASQALASKS
jgi:hypothetical protein